MLARVGLIFLAILLGVAPAEQKPERLAAGQIENVICAADATQSYSLYLPSTYTGTKRWPMIYLFDPGGQGRRPVELYRDIAEKHGFILAGSNNSRNFSGDQGKSLTAIWQDTHLRLALDDRRIYAGGFSGGARVAGAMALSCPQCRIAGVIAHGAGYPSNQPEAKNKDNLLYFFAVGDQDFNWPEVITIRREREDRGLPYRVRTFPGPHQWAPAAVMEDAIEWLMLRAMQTGELSPDAAFIDRLFRQAQAEAGDAEKTGDAIAQLSAYRSVVADFAGLKEVAETETKLGLLKKSATLKAALKKEQDQIADQSNLENELSLKLHAYVNGTAPDSMTLRNDILQAMSGLKDQAAHAKNPTRRLVSRRALDSLWIEAIETGQHELESRHFEKAEACFQLVSPVKDEPWPVLLLAETHAAAGNRKLAIKDLREAIRRGLNDPESIETDSRLQSLKSEPEFQRLLEQLKHK